MNLLDILKGHENETFYCSILGQSVKLGYLDNKDTNKNINIITLTGEHIRLFDSGSYFVGGECVLFPAKDQRIWSKWFEEQNKFPKTWSELVKTHYYDKLNLVYNINSIKSNSESYTDNLFRLFNLIDISYGGLVKEYKLFYTIRWNSKEKSFIIVTSSDMNDIIRFNTMRYAKEFIKHDENINLLKQILGIN